MTAWCFFVEPIKFERFVSRLTDPDDAVHPIASMFASYISPECRVAGDIPAYHSPGTESGHARRLRGIEIKAWLNIY